MLRPEGGGGEPWGLGAPPRGGGGEPWGLGAPPRGGGRALGTRCSAQRGGGEPWGLGAPPRGTTNGPRLRATVRDEIVAKLFLASLLLRGPQS